MLFLIYSPMCHRSLWVYLWKGFAILTTFGTYDSDYSTYLFNPSKFVLINYFIKYFCGLTYNFKSFHGKIQRPCQHRFERWHKSLSFHLVHNIVYSRQHCVTVFLFPVSFQNLAKLINETWFIFYNIRWKVSYKI